MGSLDANPHTVMPVTLTEKKLYKTGRIDRFVRNYFENNKSINEVFAKDLMPLFIQKGIFLQDHRNGFPFAIYCSKWIPQANFTCCNIVKRSGTNRISTGCFQKNKIFWRKCFRLWYHPREIQTVKPLGTGRRNHSLFLMQPLVK